MQPGELVIFVRSHFVVRESDDKQIMVIEGLGADGQLLQMFLLENDIEGDQ